MESILLQKIKDIDMSTEKTVIETLAKAGKPLKSGEIAEICGIDKKDVDKTIKLLKTKDRIFSPKRCYYAPK